MTISKASASSPYHQLNHPHRYHHEIDLCQNWPASDDEIDKEDDYKMNVINEPQQNDIETSDEQHKQQRILISYRRLRKQQPPTISDYNLDLTNNISNNDNSCCSYGSSMNSNQSMILLNHDADVRDGIVTENDDDKENEDHDDDLTISCGWLSFRPRFLIGFASIQVFVFFSCILVTLQQALSSGYFNSVMTTIEKRFDIPSRVSGAIISTFELGNLLTILFVSYFGTHRHIPVWIGKGIVITGIGSLLFALPHFMNINNPLDKYMANYSYMNNSHPLRPFRETVTVQYDENVCKIPEPHISAMAERTSSFIETPFKQDSRPTSRLSRGTSDAQGDFTLTIKSCNVKNNLFVEPHILIFMVAMILIGCGGTPVFTLGTAFIDDHVPKENSSMYIGFMYSMVAFGLVIGFLLGGYLIGSINENTYTNSFSLMGSSANQLSQAQQLALDTIHPGHPRWIGAWWLGFIILGVSLILISIPFFAFPKSLKRTKTTIITPTTAAEAANKANYGRDLKDIPRCMWNLLTNPIYIVTCLGSSLELAIVSGFLIFLPKYLETQFGLTKSQSSLYSGGVAVPGACFGILFGGYLLKRFHMKPKSAVQFVLFVNLLCMGFYTVLYFLGCPNPPMAGATMNYRSTYMQSTINQIKDHESSGKTTIDDNGRMYEAAAQIDLGLTTGDDQHQQQHFKVNLTSECNVGCKCSPNDIEPVCGQDGITYFSPCHAGCSTMASNSNSPSASLSYMNNYGDCACVSSSSSSVTAPSSLHHSSSVQTAPNHNQSSPTINHLTKNHVITPTRLATSGPCPHQCQAIVPFMILLFFLTLIVSITQMPLLMITLRSVKDEERSFALGMQFVIFRLLAYIPAPILFGNVIDGTCLLWKANCGPQSGFCLIYDIEHFRLRYIGVFSALKIAAGLLFFLDWSLICWKSNKVHETRDRMLPIGAIASSLASLDRLSAFGLTTDMKINHNQANNSETTTIEYYDYEANNNSLNIINANIDDIDNNRKDLIHHHQP